MARKRQETGIQNSEFDSLARFLLPIIRSFMTDESNQREFEAWQAERKSKLNNHLNIEKSL